MIKYLIIGLMFFGISSVVLAHTGAISGKVISKTTNQPMKNTNISIIGTSLGTATNSEGEFNILEVPCGFYKITSSNIGYEDKTIEITVLPDDTIEVLFELNIDVLNFSEVVITAERPFSVASSKILRNLDFELRPKTSAQDMLRLVPGLFIAQHAGGGKAEQIFLRGFDCDHGTDVNISVDNIPVNMGTHAHGQGYADLHFLIPETVKEMEVLKGPYFAKYGDFATAGVVSFKTLDYLENNKFLLETGMYGTSRILSLLKIAPNNKKHSTYIASEFFHTDGYFDSNQNLNRFNLFAKSRKQLKDNSEISLSISGFGSGWNASGQIPNRAIDSGNIDRWGGIDDTEGGTTQRQSINLIYKSMFDKNNRLKTQVYFVNYRFRLFSNFTFFLNDPINGDQIEQDDTRTIMGSVSEYSFDKILGNVKTTTTVGSHFRADKIGIQLWHTKNRIRIDTTVVTLVHQKSMGLFASEKISFNDVAQLQIGVRGDYFIFDLEDQKDKALSGFTQQLILSPKLNFVLSPFSNCKLFFNAGYGFHSNDARVVVSEEDESTIPNALGGEIGLRIHPFEKLLITTSLWGLDLENEFVYVGDEGTTEPSGETRRLGLDFEVRCQLFKGLWADLDISLSEGKFKDLPENENHIPLAPNLTATSGFTYRSNDIEGNLRIRHIGTRPANEDNSVQAYGSTNFDFTVKYSTKTYAFGVFVENILNTEWNEAQFDTESKLFDEDESMSELHFTPGTPRNIHTTFSVFF